MLENKDKILNMEVDPKSIDEMKKISKDSYDATLKLKDDLI